MAKVQHTVTGCVPIDKAIIEAYVQLINTDKVVNEHEDDRQEAEGQGDYSDATLYPNTRRAKEAVRQENELERQANEGTSEDERGANTRWGAEKQRQYNESVRQAAEGTPEDEAGADTRWGAEKQRQADELAREHQAGEDHTQYGLDHGASVAATERANNAAAAAEHQVDVKRGYGIASVTEPVVATTNGGVNTIRVTTEDNRTYDFYVRNGKSSEGLFATAADLPANPSVGDYAFVGADFPADIYICATAGVWTDSGNDYDGDSVDLTNYATKDYVSVSQNTLSIGGEEKGELAGQLIDNPEWVQVITDSDGKILYGVKVDGKFYFGDGCPPQVVEYITEYVGEQLGSFNAQDYADIKTFLGSLIDGDTLATLLNAKVDKVTGKSLIDANVAENTNYIQNPEYIEVKTDSEGKILQSRNAEGVNKEYVGFETPEVSIDGTTIENIQDPEWLDVKLDKDGRFIEGIKKNGTHKFYDIEVETAKFKTFYAHDYGILPTNDAMTNASLMNEILENGNVELRFTIPGTYKLGKSVKLGSNTKLVCQQGVVFTREGTYRNILINAGASTATFNENIIVDGFNLRITNEGSHTFEYSDPLFGLRGLVAFCFINKLTIRNLTINSIDSWEFALHINRAQQVVVEHFDIRCEKDGIHVASLQDFVFRDGIISTDDDGIGLNGYDFYDCNLVAGDVKYGVIEKITTLKRPNSPNKGSGVRMMVGAFVDWYDGIKVMNSELVRYGSRVYKVIDNYDSEHPQPAEKVEYTSHTPPTLTSYNDAQEAEGFYWKLNDVDTYQFSNRINVNDIVFRDIKINQGGYWVMQDIWPDGAANTRRTLHPDVTPADYPHTDNIVLENVINYGSVSPRLFESYTPVYAKVRISNCRGFIRKFECPVVSFNGHNSDGDSYSVNMPKRVILDNYDFTSRSSQEPNDVQAGENTEIIIRDCIANGNLVISSQGSIKSNCTIDALPANPKKGDTLILDGVFKCFDGTDWN